MKNNNYQSHSRRKKPWDEEEVSDIAPFVRDNIEVIISIITVL